MTVLNPMDVVVKRSKRKLLRGVALAGSATLLLACTDASESKGREPGAVGMPAGGALDSWAFEPVSVETGWSQGIAIGGVGRLQQPRALLLRNLVRDPTTNQWVPHVWSYSTSYDIQDTCGRAKGDFFLFGRRTDGEDVLERWQVVESEDSNDPHSSAPEILRTELYHGAALSGTRAMAADPDGRFLLLWRTSPGQLTRVTLQPTFAISSELSSSQEPILGSLEDVGFWRGQHVSMGRIWHISGLGAHSLVLVDSANDGTFEQRYVLDASTWAAMGFDDAVWTDDFVNRVWYR